MKYRVLRMLRLFGRCLWCRAHRNEWHDPARFCGRLQAEYVREIDPGGAWKC